MAAPKTIDIAAIIPLFIKDSLPSIGHHVDLSWPTGTPTAKHYMENVVDGEH